MTLLADIKQMPLYTLFESPLETSELVGMFRKTYSQLDDILFACDIYDNTITYFVEKRHRPFLIYYNKKMYPKIKHMDNEIGRRFCSMIFDKHTLQHIIAVDFKDWLLANAIFDGDVDDDWPLGSLPTFTDIVEIEKRVAQFIIKSLIIDVIEHNTNDIIQSGIADIFDLSLPDLPFYEFPDDYEFNLADFPVHRNITVR